jgi:hypothetical protein
MSTATSTRFKSISRKLSIQTAWSLHFLVLVSFLFFIVVHVSLVFTTGLMRDLNHIYAGRNDHSWVSFWIFVPRRVLAARVTGALTRRIATNWILMSQLRARRGRLAPTSRCERQGLRPIARHGTAPR